MKQETKGPVPEAIMQRTGARRAGDIPPEVLELLHRGQLETVNLTEWLAVDHEKLLGQIVREHGLEPELEAIMSPLARLGERKMMTVIPAVAAGWLDLMERVSAQDRARIFGELAGHRSDSVRCWAAYVIGLDQRLRLEDKLAGIRPFAADSHFGVREIAWMAVREPIARELQAAIGLLGDWAQDADANVRRFAIEATRPRGVWAKHIAALKQDPALGLPLLEAVKSDPVKYVQDSVGNWLNDAAKTNPEWVLRLCDDWLEASDTKATRRIAARATRSITKGRT
ncbi:DNA alkylation repair protein [Paenibacillus dendritiformis]|uniref:DNA alkylation repair protein n=1 Tax=Paenibacillus dendritiformis TaxID=130049 RepID=UPI0020C4A8A8|nr:DNA alkylation repair protein [Paenibacillus dendritiformis]CAH8771052.1 DNA alkylation repair protein [Paenibacillus dendritiformis]